MSKLYYIKDVRRASFNKVVGLEPILSVSENTFKFHANNIKEVTRKRGAEAYRFLDFELSNEAEYKEWVNARKPKQAVKQPAKQSAKQGLEALTAKEIDAMTKAKLSELGFNFKETKVEAMKDELKKHLSI